MAFLLRGAGLSASLVLGALAFLASHGSTAAQPVSGIALAPHRAIYDLKLISSRGRRAIESVKGRIVYDFSGNDCEGYALGFRQVTELDSGEGKVVISDLRSTTWEDGAAKSFRFNFQNFLDRKMVDSADGRAQRVDGSVKVVLTKPADKTFEIGNVAFPTEHMRRIIQAAKAGEQLLETAVYDGSENGEKVFQTLSVIGSKIVSSERAPDDAAAGNDSLAKMARWPVTISYFDKSKGAEGEQTPVYSISFEVYENGISRALKLDYGDFVVSGAMNQLEIGPTKDCR